MRAFTVERGRELQFEVAASRHGVRQTLYETEGAASNHPSAGAPGAAEVKPHHPSPAVRAKAISFQSPTINTRHNSASSGVG